MSRQSQFSSSRFDWSRLVLPVAVAGSGIIACACSSESNRQATEVEGASRRLTLIWQRDIEIETGHVRNVFPAERGATVLLRAPIALLRIRSQVDSFEYSAFSGLLAEGEHLMDATLTRDGAVLVNVAPTNRYVELSIGGHHRAVDARGRDRGDNPYAVILRGPDTVEARVSAREGVRLRILSDAQRQESDGILRDVFAAAPRAAQLYGYVAMAVRDSTILLASAARDVVYRIHGTRLVDSVRMHRAKVPALVEDLAATIAISDTARVVSEMPTIVAISFVGGGRFTVLSSVPVADGVRLRGYRYYVAAYGFDGSVQCADTPVPGTIEPSRAVGIAGDTIVEVSQFVRRNVARRTSLSAYLLDRATCG